MPDANPASTWMLPYCDVKAVTVDKYPFGEKFVAVHIRIDLIEVAMRHDRSKIVDTRVRSFDIDAGAAETARLDACKIADRYIVRSGEDAVCEVASRRQVAEVDKLLSGCVRGKRILISSGRDDVLEIDLCHCAPRKTSSALSAYLY